ncbi:Protein of unknown function [Cotesia congregata]|uniref:Uncharacterized protein n=1 Tax=Cotesia congregata TaxID=51543 RepID=A0A8J2MQ45_COTCN|nr:Protein of unknown function [Cotesia congregata]
MQLILSWFDAKEFPVSPHFLVPTLGGWYIHINIYAKLKTSIKNFSKGHVSKKSKVLSWSQFKKFINEAPDYIYLTKKVIAIFGVSGAIRGQEICDLAAQNVEDTGTQLIVTALKTKSKYLWTFVIGLEFREKIRQYPALRPKDTRTDRFFLQYHRVACIRQVFGKNSIAQAPKTIALLC